MYSLILAVIVVIGLYFIYNQISTLNDFLENIIKILRNNKGIIKNNSNKIIDEIDNAHTQSNASIFNPEALLSKFMNNDSLNPSNVAEEDVDEEEDDEEDDEEDVDEEDVDGVVVEEDVDGDDVVDGVEEENDGETGGTINIDEILSPSMKKPHNENNLVEDGEVEDSEVEEDGEVEDG